MSAYDIFSSFYDRTLEDLYLDARRESALALELRPGLHVLDLPCGTGQSFPALREGVGPTGTIVGLDLSEGMLSRAKLRASQLGGAFQLQRLDVQGLKPEDLLCGGVDRLHVFLGMSVFPDPEAAFERLWAVLKPGGRCVVVDTHAARLGVQGFLVNMTAGADIRRRSWEPLERRATHFSRRELPSRWQHGGQLFLAMGQKA